MPQKKYKLSSNAAPFVRGGDFSFRVRFSTQHAGGGFTMHGLDKCPVISVAQGGVVATEDPIAQRMIESFIVPSNTIRGGSRRADDHSTKMFSDVTETGQSIDVDLDPIFENARGG